MLEAVSIGSTFVGKVVAAHVHRVLVRADHNADGINGHGLAKIIARGARSEAEVRKLRCCPGAVRALEDICHASSQILVVERCWRAHHGPIAADAHRGAKVARSTPGEFGGGLPRARKIGQIKGNTVGSRRADQHRIAVH